VAAAGEFLMSRHRHTVNVRADGLQAVLGPLLRDRRVVTAVLVDVDSGMVLDAWSSHLTRVELEQLGAGQAELVRTARAGASGPDPECEIVVSHGDGWHHVVRTVPDPHGDRLALGVVVAGRRRVLERARRRLRVVSAPALTAGPTMSRRPAALALPPPTAPLPGPVPPSPAGPARTGPPPAEAPALPQPRAPRTPADREDAALLTLGDGYRADGVRGALALGADGLRPGPVALDGGGRRPGPPILRAVPPSAVPPGALSPAGPDPDRPRAPLSALAPGPRRVPPTDGRSPA
jgi:hypothetical protein